MTLKEILFKLFKRDMKKYRLFVLCNLASIAVLYSFIAIVSNKQFMDRNIVNPMISSNIYAPTYLVLVFMIIFLPYAQGIFIKSRQRDYGILLTIGMSKKQVRNNVLIENFLLGLISLVVGLIAGTFIALFFLYFMANIIGINGITIDISVQAYKTTTLYVLGIFVISLAVNAYGMFKSTIYHKIKLAERPKSKKNYSFKLALFGIVITLSAFLLILFLANGNDTVYFTSLFIAMLGSLLIFFNGEAFLHYFKNKKYKGYLKNIFVISDLSYYYDKNKKVFFTVTWIFFAIFFFVTVSLMNYSNIKKYSITYHPFHMAYGEVENYSKPLSDEEIKEIARSNGNSITASAHIKFIRNNAFTIFSVDDVNRIIKKNYKLNLNSFIYVYPYDMKDGYEHDIDFDKFTLNISSGKSSKNLTKQATEVTPLFGHTHCIADRIILVSEEDFQWISSNSTDYKIKGKLHLYNFSDWRKSDAIVNQVDSKLMARNGEAKDGDFYKVSSRIEEYNVDMKSCEFLAFLIVYVCFLLYFSIIIILHFKLGMEYKEEKRKFFNLYKLGITSIEIKKIISKKVLIIYFLSFIYALLVSVPYNYYIYGAYISKPSYFLDTIAAAGIFIIIHLTVYHIYSGEYYKKIIEELN